MKYGYRYIHYGLKIVDDRGAELIITKNGSEFVIELPGERIRLGLEDLRKIVYELTEIEKSEVAKWPQSIPLKD